MPAGPDHPYFLLDLSSHFPWDEECFRKMPQVFLKALGLSHVGNIMSGTLGGQMLPEFDRRNISYSGAEQSGFYMALDIERFVPLSAFQADMDHLMNEISQMQPFPGFTEATLPGGRAWNKEREYLAAGIPLSAQAIQSLEGLAQEMKLSIPW